MNTKWFTTWPRGFWIEFDNWHALSVQFWYGNYCDNYNIKDLLQQKETWDLLNCANAEVAIKYNNDLVTQELWYDIFKENIDDSVASHITPEQVAVILSYISILPNKN